VPAGRKGRWRRALASAGESADLVFPPNCINCLGLVEGDDHGFRYLCSSCRRRLVLAQEPHCVTCGYPFFGAVDENVGCLHCEELDPLFREGRTAGLLQGPLRRLVHALKYEGAVHLVRDVEALVRRHPHFRDFLAGAVLIPVPLHPRKQRERGFNQAHLLAEAFAAVVNDAVVKSLMKRVIDTPTQTRFDREQRQTNLKNAFALADDGGIQTDLRYVLVDDVFTTGATLNACAKVLRHAGLTAIDVATLGHG